MPALSEWLQLMLGEIARKREELERAHAEEQRRELENATERREAPQLRDDQLTSPGRELREHDQAAREEQALAERAARR